MLHNSIGIQPAQDWFLSEHDGCIDWHLYLRWKEFRIGIYAIKYKKYIIAMKDCYFSPATTDFQGQWLIDTLYTFMHMCTHTQTGIHMHVRTNSRWHTFQSSIGMGGWVVGEDHYQF